MFYNLGFSTVEFPSRTLEHYSINNDSNNAEYRHKNSTFTFTIAKTCKSQMPFLCSMAASPFLNRCRKNTTSSTQSAPTSLSPFNASPSINYFSKSYRAAAMKRERESLRFVIFPLALPFLQLMCTAYLTFFLIVISHKLRTDLR